MWELRAKLSHFDRWPAPSNGTYICWDDDNYYDKIISTGYMFVYPNLVGISSVKTSPRVINKIPLSTS